MNTTSAILGNNSRTITVTGGGVTQTAHVALTLNAPATSSVTLTWTANTDNDLAEYKVYALRHQGSTVHRSPHCKEMFRPIPQPACKANQRTSLQSEPMTQPATRAGGQLKVSKSIFLSKDGLDLLNGAYST
jgi:hypothetical protein